MIELYVGLTLGGLGYILNQNRVAKSNPIKQINPSELPSSTNPYDSSHTKIVNKVESNLAAKKFNDTTGKVIFRDNVPVKSLMSGQNIPISDFKHNNMTPFYRGSLKHVKIDNNGLSQNLETFTGAHQYYQPKREVEHFFKPEKNLGNMNGSKPVAEFIQTRTDGSQSKIHNNVLPFSQIRVGPGLNKGYSSTPTGGFQQLEVMDYAKPRTTNELRAANKPKDSYAGRTVDGQKGSMRGIVGKFDKNRVTTYYDNNPDRYFKTTGAYLKEKMQPEVDAKYTSRQDVSTKGHVGGAFQKTKGDKKEGAVTSIHKDQLDALGITNASLSHLTNQSKDDYGKGSIQIYDNERSITSTQTYQGNLTSLVKSIIAPIEDFVKISRKEYTVEAPREYGQMQATIPGKATIYDPNAVTRTTIKETLIHDSTKLNLVGAPKLTIYDPNAITRTTIKETLLHDSTLMNIKGESVGQAFDAKDYIPRTTGRETVDDINPSRNIGQGGTLHAGKVYDPNDITRTTMKETTIDARGFGNANRQENFKGSYEEQVFEVNETQKHVITQDSDYSGNPNKQGGDAYVVVQDASVPRETQKEFVTDNEYYGTAGDKTTHKTMSYEDAYNATFDELKEELELTVARDPTQTSVKVANGAEDIVLQTRKNECDSTGERFTNNADHVVNVPLDAKTIALTKYKNDYDDNDRLDVSILDALKDNDLSINLN